MTPINLPPSRFRMLRFLNAHVSGQDERKPIDQKKDLGLLNFRFSTFINENRINLKRYDPRNALFDFCLTDGSKVTGYMVNAMYFNAHNVY